LRLEALPFSDVPGQSQLFLDYLQDPLKLKQFYPNAVRFHHELAAFAPHVTARYTTNRTQLCDALARMNTAWGASEKTLANIEVLRAADSVAVVTGQQIGLFTGPLYTIHKALTAVKIVACLAARGVAAVPVFWMASEDHDWDEVSAADFLACDARLARAEAPAHLHDSERAVGEVILDDSIHSTLERLFDSLPNTEFTPELRRALQDAYASGRTYTEAFARFLTYLTKRFGLVLLDPLDPNSSNSPRPFTPKPHAAPRRSPKALCAALRNSHAPVITRRCSRAATPFRFSFMPTKTARRQQARGRRLRATPKVVTR
jgi:uncharacterized protein YllA (UPF0747 family)